MLDIELIGHELPWLAPLADRWIGAEERGRMPHAVLLAGAPGVGKRCAAAWLAERRLARGGQAPPLPRYPAAIRRHADLHWIVPEEGKRTILIDQVRELVAELSLTSYEGRGKVAVIEPANAMTDSAANSLLKTLEEPPGETLIVLIADRIAGLPATIFSRCQRLAIPIPAEEIALEWLSRLQPGADWLPALGIAGGAPLAAVEARERLGEAETMTQGLRDILQGRASPVATAAAWSTFEPAFVLDWLGRQVQQCIHRLSGSAGAGGFGEIGESVLKRMDRRNLFCYLDTINRLRNQPAGSYNVQLTLESLLIDWAEGLGSLNGPWNFRKGTMPGGSLPLAGGR
jgi:DNA polymerase III subunit delta'